MAETIKCARCEQKRPALGYAPIPTELGQKIGASVYRTFLSSIERWIVTEVPLTVWDADTFMPAGYLDGFTLTATKELADELVVKFYTRVK